MQKLDAIQIVQWDENWFTCSVCTICKSRCLLKRWMILVYIYVKSLLHPQHHVALDVTEEAETVGRFTESSMWHAETTAVHGNFLYTTEFFSESSRTSETQSKVFSHSCPSTTSTISLSSIGNIKVQMEFWNSRWSWKRYGCKFETYYDQDSSKLEGSVKKWAWSLEK